MHKMFHRCKFLQGHSKSLKQHLKYYSTGEVTAKATFKNGRVTSVSTGSAHPLADAAALATVGDTAVVATALAAPSSGPDPGFLPLTVDYRTSPFHNRHRQREDNVLTGRQVDRSIRPMFDKHFRRKTEVVCQLDDGGMNADIAAINAASAALAISELPWRGPVGAVRVGFCDDEWFINPTAEEMQHSAMDLTVTAGPNKTVVMLEGGANNLESGKIQQAISKGVTEAQVIIRAIEELAAKAGKEKIVCEETNIPEELTEAVRKNCEEPLKQILSDFSHHKQSRDQALDKVRTSVIETLTGQFPDIPPEAITLAYNQCFSSVFRNLILDTDIRCDGRNTKQLRNLSCSVGVKKSAHGSSLFQRGQTIVKSSLMFGPVQPYAHRQYDEIGCSGVSKDDNFQLRYSFPGAATNEMDGGKGRGRREVGHGALAERALRPLVPPCEESTVALDALVVSSNGSSSMATVCGGSLALYDAGVCVASPCAGVAMGLVCGGEGDARRYKVLTDILGIEDYLGDMDFKIAGSRQGVTALQCDVKPAGVPLGVINEALLKSQSPRQKIIKVMDAVIDEPRVENSKWPVSESVEIPPHKRSVVIGPGGSTLRKLTHKTGVSVSWLEDNTLLLWAPDRSKYDAAKAALDALLEEKEPTLDFGAVYTARIVELRDTGVMVELKEGMSPVLVHNAQLDMKKVFHPSVLGLSVGDSIKVKYFGRDEHSGQLRVSRKAVQLMGSLSRTSVS